VLLTEQTQSVRTGLLSVSYKLLKMVGGIRVQLDMNSEVIGLPSPPGERGIPQRRSGEPHGVIGIQELRGTVTSPRQGQQGACEARPDHNPELLFPIWPGAMPAARNQRRSIRTGVRVAHRSLR
jgi:hypothetical protein